MVVLHKNCSKNVITHLSIDISMLSELTLELRFNFIFNLLLIHLSISHQVIFVGFNLIDILKIYYINLPKLYSTDETL